MKNLMLAMVVVVLFGGSLYLYFSHTSTSEQFSPLGTSFKKLESASKKIILPIPKEYIFIPYWTMTGSKLSVEEKNILLYFGVSGDEGGINTSDPGFKSLSSFDELSDSNKKLLTVRMLDSEANSRIIKDDLAQEKVIDEALITAREHGFEGILLDFEMSALPLEGVIKRVSYFYVKFSKAARKENLSFSSTIFGDVFYRARAYDVEEIAKVSDYIFIMAYDFHKANGNPGPNFPLSGENTYGYDFSRMIQDFTSFVPSEKLVVIYGMFGYDWIVNDKGKSAGAGKALSLNKIKQDFIDSCIGLGCVFSSEPQSSEGMIRYLDNSGKKHIVWFDSLESVEKKKKFASRHGIYSFAYWAYSYY